MKANVAQLVEHWLPKPVVAGSNPVIRSIFLIVIILRDCDISHYNYYETFYYLNGKLEGGELDNIRF